MHINDLLKMASERKASDLHLKVGSHPVLRINGELIKDVDHFDTMIKKLPSGKSVPVLIQRRGGPIFLALRVPEGN